MTNQENQGCKKGKTGNGAVNPNLAFQKNQEANETLNFNSLNLTVFPDVYFPHEDSFLLADAAERFASGKVLDMGCGSGIAGIIAAKKNPKVESVTFADIAKTAIDNARLNCQHNQIAKPIHFIRSDLFSMLKNMRFDTILFNPPYLPTNREEKLKGKINHAFDGGRDGRKVIDKFLPEFGKHLEKNGNLLYLDSSLTDSQKTEKWLNSHGFNFSIVSSQRFFFEEIRVLEIRGK